MYFKNFFHYILYSIIDVLYSSLKQIQQFIVKNLRIKAWVSPKKKLRTAHFCFMLTRKVVLAIQYTVLVGHVEEAWKLQLISPIFLDAAALKVVIK